jgi:hypothetical protein
LAFDHEKTRECTNMRCPGPKVNIEHQMLGRDENVIVGKDGSEDSENGSVAAREAGDKKANEVA